MTTTPVATTLLTLVYQLLAAHHLPVRRVFRSGMTTVHTTSLDDVLQASVGAGRLWLETYNDHWVQLDPRYGWSSLEDCSAGVDDILAPIWRYASQQQLLASGRLATVPSRVVHAAGQTSSYSTPCPRCMGSGMATPDPDEEPGCYCDNGAPA